MALTTEQERFLIKYVNAKGNVYQALEEMGLEINHLMMWKENQEFEFRYKETVQKVLTFLNQQNYMIGVRKLNEALTYGLKQDTITHSHKILDTGETQYEVKKTTKNLGVTPEILKLALQESTIVKAINTLVNNGVIPNSIARKILLKSEELATEMQKAFTINDEETINESRALSIIKTAILGATNE